MLASRVPSHDIARSKTYAIIGQGLDFTALESNDENEDLTEVLDGSAEDKMFLRKHLLAEAKSYRELEALTESLDYMETVTSMGYLLQEYDIIVHSKLFFTNFYVHRQSSPKWQKGWRQQLAKAVQPTRASVQPLLKGWLLSNQQGECRLRMQISPTYAT
jgi:nuclear pore complex protein Nup107